MLSEVGSILMLHRVAQYEEGTLIQNENMKIDPDELTTIIEELKSSNKVFVGLDEVVEILQRKKRYRQQFIVFTLDDGYKDNLTCAYPVFKQYNIPFCIYVTNSFPNRTTNLWWYALEQLVLENDSLIIRGERVENANPESKERNFQSLRAEILSKHFLNPLSFLSEAGNLKFDLDKHREEKCLTWDDIIVLSNDCLVTIGAHTVNHYPVSMLSGEQAFFELQASKAEIEQICGKEVRHLAFPFGTSGEAGKREFQLARRAGYQSAVTTRNGHIYPWSNRENLDRIFIYPLKRNSVSLNQLMHFKPMTRIKQMIRSLVH